MSRLIIWGASEDGLKLKKELDRQGAEINFFCDNNDKKIGEKLDGIQIISFEQVVEIQNTGLKVKIIIASSLNSADRVVEQIRNSGIDANVYMVSYEWKYRKNKVFQFPKEFLYEIDISKPRLEYYEYHVADHCNLKCKGCGHYSNVAAARFGDLEQYKKDIKRLKELFWGVKRIRLMGGEPLLNTKLADFCVATREIFPDANIRVVTNGLLIPSINKEILEAMEENYIGFDITQYPPTSEMVGEIELKCIENNIHFSLSPVVEKFFHYNIADESDKIQNHGKCVSQKCHFLENGKISVCAFPILWERIASKITDQKINLLKEDSINIYEEELTGFKLNDFLSNPIPMCRYCDYTKMEWFEWRGNYPHLI